MLFCTTAISIGDNWSVYKCRLYFSAPFLFHFSLKRSRSAKKSNSFLRVSWDDKVISSYDLPKTICICLLLDKIQTDAKLNGMRNKCKASDQITNDGKMFHLPDPKLVCPCTLASLLLQPFEKFLVAGLEQSTIVGNPLRGNLDFECRNHTKNI